MIRTSAKDHRVLQVLERHTSRENTSWNKTTLPHLDDIRNNLDARLGEIVKIDKMQLRYIPWRGTTDAIFVPTQTQVKNLEGQTSLYHAHHRVASELVWCCITDKWVPMNVM